MLSTIAYLINKDCYPTRAVRPEGSGANRIYILAYIIYKGSSSEPETLEKITPTIRLAYIIYKLGSFIRPNFGEI